MEKENFTLKKIRYYQGTIDDYAKYWEKRINDDESNKSDDIKKIRDRNAQLNKDFEIIPVEND